MYRSTFAWSHAEEEFEVSCQLHAPAALPPGERSAGTNSSGGWVDPRAGLDDVEILLTLPGNELRPLHRPTHSQSLYRPHYPGH
jgi:hypothetical protein